MEIISCHLREHKKLLKLVILVIQFGSHLFIYIFNYFYSLHFSFVPFISIFLFCIFTVTFNKIT